jgi:large subunit ribosomal protein L9
MKVILLVDVPKIGNRYDIKDLKDGFAQNVLISKGLAVLASKSELAKIENRKKENAHKMAEESRLFEEILSKVNGKEIVIKSKANEKGHLFKSVGPKEIILAIKEATGYLLDEKSITIPSIKEIGGHVVKINNKDHKGQFEVIVRAL